jgi:transcriptional regulator with XRE-family HTH domain
LDQSGAVFDTQFFCNYNGDNTMTETETNSSRELTQTEIAKMMGVKQPQVSNWLSGKRIPNAENLIKLSNILELYPEELLEQLQSRREQA